MKTKIITIAMLLSSTYMFAQWQTFGNTVLPGQFLGSTNNQPINIRTNNLMRATFTTGNAFGTGTTQGDGLRIFDNSGGPGHLDLWTSSSTQTHIRWSGSGTIQGINNRFELLANYKGFWFNTTNINGQYIFNQEGTEVGRIGTNNNWRIGLNPSNVNAQRRLEVFDNSNKPQFRITYAINAGANADFQVSSEGNLHVVPQTSGNVGALAIGFFPDELSPPTPETFLDVGNKGITRFRNLPFNKPKTMIIGYQYEDVNNGAEDHFLGRLDFPEENQECFVLNGEGQWMNICDGILGNDCRWFDVPSATIPSEKDMRTGYNPEEDCYRGKVAIGEEVVKDSKLMVLNLSPRDNVKTGIAAYSFVSDFTEEVGIGINANSWGYPQDNLTYTYFGIMSQGEKDLQLQESLILGYIVTV